MPSKQGPPTLADVAASAGVSIATVSKVLNGRADVGPGTRARVQSILQQHDYVGRRSEPAEPALKRATVELVFHGQLNSYSVEVLRGVVEAANQGRTVAVSVRPRQLGRVSNALCRLGPGRDRVRAVRRDRFGGRCSAR